MIDYFRYWQEIKRPLVFFIVMASFMAFMDGFNFYFPHNDGWLSLTYGPGTNSWDIWHILKRLIFLVFFIYVFRIKLYKIKWWITGVLFALAVYLCQVLIYNGFIKLF